MFQLEGVKYKNILDIKQLSIPANKITCIVGESGSGKTTLLKLLNKMISCSEGEIFYNNDAISTINSIELRRKVVMLPQVPAVFPGTVKENLLIGLKFSEKPAVNDEKLSAVLNMVQLNKPLDEDADKLSGGEKQRLALGRVILMDPEIFLLDEPSSALDEDTEQNIIEKLVHYIKETNKTLIMVTHSKKIARAYADNIIEIKNGRVLN
ncbi:putative ABC transport system ATP-binding protein [Desulfohalotomaculum tongense]|uniref:ABC transporter ATP-binding protein n=1 Tax=Desulforadius tongensis TaxID=1216062 RepID=UPI001958E35A|nr:ABC transporter ATP-binding protein [Desulforadius tongensis]MBM7853909.1 putative ABC transport system ATP-binding protein [Desulforadius tongensis]